MNYGSINPMADDTVIQGNLTIVPNPNDPAQASGSVEISDRLFVDAIDSNTPNTRTTFIRPIAFQTLQSVPGATSFPQLFSSGQHSGRLAILDSGGRVLDINPLQYGGDTLVYDGDQATAIRRSRGLPGQRLTQVGTTTRWKGDTLRDEPILVPTDAFFRYAHLVAQSEVRLTNALQSIPFFVPDAVSRFDFDTFKFSDAYTLELTQPGIFSFTWKVTALVDVDSQPEGLLTSVEAQLETSIESNGYGYVKGGKSAMLLQKQCRQTMIGKAIISLPVGTKVRLTVKEGQRNSGSVSVLSDFTTLSVQRLSLADAGGDASEYLFVRGTPAQRPVLTDEDWTSLPIADTNAEVITKTNASDTMVEDQIVFAVQRMRLLTSRMVFVSVGVPASTSISLVTRVMMNGTLLPHSERHCTLLLDTEGIQTTVECVFCGLVDVAAGDALSLQAKIMSGKPAVGSVVIASELSTCSSLTFKNLARPDAWKVTCMENDLPVMASTAGFQAIPLSKYFESSGGPFLETFDDHRKLTLQIGEAGTYFVEYSGTFSGSSTISPRTLHMALQTNDANSGLRILYDTATASTLMPGAERVSPFGCTSLYLDAGSSVSLCAFVDTPQGKQDNENALVADPHEVHIVIYKIEETRFFSNESNAFGTFHVIAQDDEEVTSTSTGFSTRLSAVTANLPTADFRVGLSFMWKMTDPAYPMAVRLRLDDGQVLYAFQATPYDVSEWRNVTWFGKINMLDGQHEVSFEVSVPEGNRALITKDVSIEIWKVS